jgi:FemAB-related protein (PEP-CTERM system-associated)
MSTGVPDRVVLYDGGCGLCLRSVNLVIDHDPAGTLRFASLRSDLGRALVAGSGRDPDDLDTLLFLEDGRVHDRSEGALRIARHLERPWCFLSWLRVVPRPLRDAVYRLVAARRLAWFGTAEGCRLPSPELVARFLDGGPWVGASAVAEGPPTAPAELTPPVPWRPDPAVRVAPLGAAHVAAADALVAAQGGSIFQRSGWRRAVARSFGHADHSLGAWRGGELVGVLPLMRSPRLLGGRNLISTPYGVYGGPVAVEEGVAASLVEAGAREAHDLGAGRLELRSRAPLPVEGLVASDLYVTFEKPLPGDFDEVLASMKKDERRLVRRAADTHGLVVETGDHLLAELTELFHASKRRLGSPGLPEGWFRALLEELPGQVVLHRARRGRETLAISLSFVDGGSLRMYYIGTDEGANERFATTSFLIAELQRWAIARGLSTFDLGRSRADAGAARFKRNQGFVAAPLHYAYLLVRDRELPSFHPSNPRTAVLRRTWSRLPAPVCEALSGALARYLP